jgi:hypothetical protein
MVAGPISRGSDVPALGWRRGAARKVWPVVLELTVATACSGGYLVRRDGAAELGSYGGGGALQGGGAARRTGEEGGRGSGLGRWIYMGAEREFVP